jgi:hypothetical protein
MNESKRFIAEDGHHDKRRRVGRSKKEASRMGLEVCAESFVISHQ